MPRLPKWLRLKEWLTHDDCVKILENSATELENILARDESEEFGYSYKFVCTFAPRDCQKEIKEYRFEQTARQSMRAHLKEHVNCLKADSSSETESEFLTRNQLFQQSKTHKHKMSVNKNEIPPKKSKSASKSDALITQEKEPINEKPKAKRRRKNNQFTELKQASVDRENIQHIVSPIVKEELIDVSDVTTTSVINVIQSEVAALTEILTPHMQNEFVNFSLDEQGHETEIDDDDLSDKISCETQTDHGKKELETAQYRIATKLFAIDRTQWGDIEKTFEELIAIEDTSQEISEDDKLRILDAMKQWMDSVKLYNRRATESLQDPLSPSEEGILDSLTTEDWRRLDAADDPESKLRLTVYARMLLRDYVWYPRKLKPKVCRHCQRQYTASTSLYSHLVSLSGIRFWVCSKCKDDNRDEATFTRKHSLQYHILKEVGIPRYRCSQPGCSKTHNHTHHQKSHARQHTGEQYYKCEVVGCKVRFSNRNTYSRHLLQNHSTELTSANQLRAIDKTEAQMKVYAARLRARERSKCKRQQTNDGSFMEEEVDKLAMQDRPLNRLVVNEPKYPSSDVIPTSLGKFMRPSASQLLYGIARDVRNTTSTIEGVGKPADNMLGGLNLLATVSKYMNAENCIDDPQKLDCEKEMTKASCLQNDKGPQVNATFTDNKQYDISKSANAKGSSVSVLSSFPSDSTAPVSSCKTVMSGEQIANLTVLKSVNASSVGDIILKMSSPHVVNIAPTQYKLPMPSSLQDSSVSVSEQPKVNAINNDASGSHALNMQSLGNKIILRSPVINTVTSAQIHSPTVSSSEAPMTLNEKQDSSYYAGNMDVTQSFQEMTDCTSVLSTAKTIPIGSTDTVTGNSTCLKTEVINHTNIMQEARNDKVAMQSKMATPNSHLQLRSISSVSGKTYIILASSPKGTYMHNLQPYVKESDSNTDDKLVVGTPIPLS